jgi:hypothetical protein
MNLLTPDQGAYHSKKTGAALPKDTIRAAILAISLSIE